jgi:hypothetical protein
LLTLKAETRNRLREASTSVNLRRLPSVMSKVGIKGDEGIDERP